MLEIRLLGQFDLRLDGRPVELASRPAQSLLSYLVLNPGVPYRREKLAGLLWPDATEANARSSLRHALWLLRKAVEPRQRDAGKYLLIEELTIAFNRDSEYWLDAAEVDRKIEGEWSATDLMGTVQAYRGELLPGFYDDWVVLERERLQASFEHKMGLLLERLVAEGRWGQVLEWGERWIALGQTPELAYRALMSAHARLGDLSRMVAVYRRCVEALHRDLGVEPSEQTRTLYDRLSKGEKLPTIRLQPVAQPVPVIAQEPPAPGEPPFKGLQYFEEADADLFFGRETLTAKLAGRLREGRTFIAVVGASGSGKSSLVRAGLIPALKRGEAAEGRSHPMAHSRDWPVHLITPTAHPLEALAVSLTRDTESVTAAATLLDDLMRDPRALHLAVRRILAGAGAARLALVVDQFEELFTLCRHEAERQAFVDNLLMATTLQTEGPTLLVITLRADFYAHCAQYANLREALANYQEYIGPMSAEELRRAIEEPARRGGWEFEPVLVDLLMREAGGEPGSLPLLSHALLETWQRRGGRTLTLRGYAESGGMRGAIARTAERVYRELGPPQQGIARGIFLRLTALGEGTLDTPRRAGLSELTRKAEEAEEVEAVLRTLADARLIMTGEGVVEVAHEALIREWPALRGWLAEDREGLRLHRRLTEAAQAWEALERDPGELYRGARLAQALEWARAHAQELNVLERGFLEASREWEQRRAAEREAARQRELEAAQKLAEAESRRAEEQARAARELRRRAVGLTVASVLGVALAVVAIVFAGQARQEAHLAFARELAAAAVDNLAIDPERSILLALQAVSQTYSADGTVLPEAENALHRSIQSSRVQLTLSGHTDQVLEVAFSPDGMRVATASLDGTAKVWDTVSGQVLLTLGGHSAGVTGVAFSPDGSRLATASQDKTARVWDASSGQVLLTLPGHGDGVEAVGFSPDGTRLATASRDQTARVWDAVSGDELLVLSGHTDAVLDLAFSPDGTRLVTASRDQTARVWDAFSGQEYFNLSAHTHIVEAVAFGPDGKRLLTTSWDVTARVWNVAPGESGGVVFTLSGHTGSVLGGAFSPEGTRLATASSDGTARVWDAFSGQELMTLSGHAGAVREVAFSPDGTRLATASIDKTVKVWDLSLERELLTLSGHTAPVFRLAFSPDGMRLATASWDKTAKVWDAASGRALLTLSGHSGRVLGIAFSPDGSRVATAGEDGTVRVWDATTGTQLLTLTGYSAEVVEGAFGGVLDVAFHLDGVRLAAAGAQGWLKIWNTSVSQESLAVPAHARIIESLTFSPDGSRLGTASWDGTARVWDAATGEELLRLMGHTDRVLDIAFSSDGRRLATAGADGTARVWDPFSGQESFTLSGHSGGIAGVAFSPDGTRLATASVDTTTKVWDISSESELLTLSGHSRLVFDVAFSPNGTRLATASFDKTVRLYVLPIEDLVELAQARVTRSLTTEECRKFLHLEECPPGP